MNISRHKRASESKKKKTSKGLGFGEERERGTVSRVLIHLKLVIQIPPPVSFIPVPLFPHICGSPHLIDLPACEAIFLSLRSHWVGVPRVGSLLAWLCHL